MTKSEALEQLEKIAYTLSVSRETLDNPEQLPCDWTWEEQNDYAEQLQAIWEALSA